jgi:uncharacterized SAM-binding protein YcdF (DUF218 family)
VIVIMGAAVAADGTPGAALVRRTRMALRVGAQLRDPFYLPTGGPRPGLPAEAHVVRRLLREAGVRASRIVVEDRAEDTLQSVRYCTEIIRRLHARTVVICTDRYHLVRCRSLFALAGVPTRAATACRAPAPAGLARGLIAWTREAVALPLDVALFLASRLRDRLSPAR